MWRGMWGQSWWWMMDRPMIPRVFGRSRRGIAGAGADIDAATKPGEGVALIRGFSSCICGRPIATPSSPSTATASTAPGIFPASPGRLWRSQTDLVIAQRQFPPSVPARSRIGKQPVGGDFVGRVSPHAARYAMRPALYHNRDLAEWVSREYRRKPLPNTEGRILMTSLRFQTADRAGAHPGDLSRQE